MTISIFHQDNLEFLKTLPDDHVDLIYTDPPFNTKKTQKRKLISGSFGSSEERKVIGEYGSFEDSFDDYLGFLRPRMQEAHRVLKKTGSIYVHLNYREVHYVKVMMDEIFGRENFKNEIIWNYEWGAKSRTRWSAKHDTILFYTKSDSYTFNFDKVPRVPYMAPDLVSEEKAKLGKTVTDVWWHTIVGTNSKEKQNYATQKPVGLLRRIVDVSSNPKDLCLDFFAGSGSFGQACLNGNRDCLLVDSNTQAIQVMKKRFQNELEKTT